MVELDFTLRNVLLGAALLGLSSGTLGSFALLRQQSLLGDTLAHAALPGVCLGFLLSGTRAPLRALVVYESMFGNTEEVARDVAAGLIDAGVLVQLVEVTCARPADEYAFDLLVVGARRGDGHVGLQLGRVAHGLLHHSACPVVVVPDGPRDAAPGPDCGAVSLPPR